MKQKILCIYYFRMKRKKLFGQPNTIDKTYVAAKSINLHDQIE